MFKKKKKVSIKGSRNFRGHCLSVKAPSLSLIGRFRVRGSRPSPRPPRGSFPSSAGWSTPAGPPSGGLALAPRPPRIRPTSTHQPQPAAELQAEDPRAKGKRDAAATCLARGGACRGCQDTGPASRAAASRQAVLPRSLGFPGLSGPPHVMESFKGAKPESLALSGRGGQGPVEK